LLSILRFDAATQPILVIGDVGISRFHTQETFLRNEDTATAATTPSYEAPEAHGGSKDKRSRRYDIWSLGCIYLEFVIWLLYGNDAVLELEQARKTPDRQSYFYKPVDDATISVHPKITEAIDALRKSPHCEPGSPMGHLVDLIEKDLLRIDIYSRAEAAEVVSKLREIVSSAETSNTLKHMTLLGPASKPAIFRSSGKKSRHQGPKDSVHGTSSFGLSGP
jgi:serine/threonine protein kinase